MPRQQNAKEYFENEEVKKLRRHIIENNNTTAQLITAHWSNYAHFSPHQVFCLYLCLVLADNFVFHKCITAPVRKTLPVILVDNIMQRLLIASLLFIFLGCSQSKIPMIITQDYIFLNVDGGMTKLKQSNDTLYELFCSGDGPCHEFHYKIIAIQQMTEFTILKLEYLDSIPLRENLCPEKKYGITALKKINNERLSYCDPLYACLTKQQLDTIQIKFPLHRNEQFLTYFSDSYLKKLSTFKKISSKEDMEIVVDAIENNDFNSGKISYSAEQLNNACIEKGYDPKCAGLIMDSIWTSIQK